MVARFSKRYPWGMKMLVTVGVIGVLLGQVAGLSPQGAVKGRVVFEGKRPVVQELTITEAQSKGCVHEGSKMDARDMTLLIHEDGGIANAVVTIAVADQELIVPKDPVVLDQSECRFDQHIAVVTVGTTVEFKNSDSVSHNVHTYSRKNKAFNRTLPGGTSHSQVMTKAEAIPVGCDLHPWMKAYLVVVDTNFYALTDEHGGFEIQGMVAGSYTAKVWHEKLSKSQVAVTVDEKGKSETVEVALKPKKASKRGR